MTLPLVGHSLRVWFCPDCGECEGSTPQAGCCANCGSPCDPVRANVVVSTIQSDSTRRGA